MASWDDEGNKKVIELGDENWGYINVDGIIILDVSTLAMLSQIQSHHSPRHVSLIFVYKSHMLLNSTSTSQTPNMGRWSCEFMSSTRSLALSSFRGHLIFTYTRDSV
jgi:hypothetical protein